MSESGEDRPGDGSPPVPPEPVSSSTAPVPPDQVSPPPAGGRGSRMIGNRGFLISAASTLVFFVVIGLIIALSPGSDIVAERFFDWEHLKDSFFGTPGSPGVAEAFLQNVRMFVIAEFFILIFGLLIAIVRGIPGPVFFPFRALAVIYTDLFRGIPLILVLYMIGFGVPGLGLQFVSSRSEVTYGIAALVLVYSAYVAEVYRAGIDSIHSSQTAAARSLGLSRWKALRFVVLPQAVRRVIPPLLNDFIGLQKDTALVSVLGTVEAARAAQIYGAEQFNYASYVVAAMLFVAVTIPLARFTDHLIARDQKKRAAGALA